MSANILAIILDNVSPQFVGRCSSMLGLDRTITEKAMNAAIPAVLAGMARAVGRPDGARQLGNALSSEPGKLSTEPGNWFEGMAAPTVGAGQQPMTPAGSSILSPLLGSGGMKAINDAVSRYSGVAPGQASNATNMAGLLAVNGLGRVQRETGLDSSGLAHALTSQAPQFAAAMPPGFSDILRNAEGSRPEATNTRPVEETRRRVDTQRAVGSDMTPMPNWLYWALGLLAILGIAWLLQPAFNEPQVATAP